MGLGFEESIMMQVSGRRRIGTAVFASLVALFVGACSASDDDPGASVPSFEGPGATPAPSEQTPPSGICQRSAVKGS